MYEYDYGKFRRILFQAGSQISYNLVESDMGVCLLMKNPKVVAAGSGTDIERPYSRISQPSDAKSLGSEVGIFLIHPCRAGIVGSRD